jgi:hypothetical protein
MAVSGRALSGRGLSGRIRSLLCASCRNAGVFCDPLAWDVGKHFYFLFAPPPAERDCQVALVTAPIDGAVLEASERMEW